MTNYQYDEESVKAIVAWAQSAQLPQSLCLTESENIHDVQRFVQANIYDIEEHYPNPYYQPAITRLYRLKDALEGRQEDTL